MKYRVFILTFLGYMSLHIMRMTYSFSKPAFKQKFNLSNIYLAFIDSIVYISLGVGFLLRYNLASKMKLTKTYFIFTSIAGLAYLVIPIVSLLNLSNENNENVFKVLFFISMGSFGFFQFSAWPVGLLLMSQYFSLEFESGLIGFWSASTDSGNIGGFLIPSLLQNLCTWEIPMLIAGIYSIGTSICIRKCLKQKSIQEVQEDQEYSLIFNNEEDSQALQNSIITPSEFWNYLKLSFTNQKILIFVVIICFYKGLMYGFLLWIPTFIESIGYGSVKGYIAMAFDLSAVIGSYCFGKIGQGEKRQKYANKTHIQKYYMFYLSLLVIVSLSLFNIIKNQLIVYIILLCFAGVSIGPIFNILTANQLIQITENRQRQKSLLVTLYMALANIFTGILEALIGMFLGDEQPTADSTVYSTIFIILLIVSGIGSALTLYRCKIRAEEDKDPKQESHINQY